MKKSILSLSGLCLLIALTFSSCAKDRICECTTPFGGTEEIEYENVTKKWMKNSADCVSYTVTSDGESYSVDCEIK